MRRQLPITPLEQYCTASGGFPQHVTNITGAIETLSVLRPRRHTWLQQKPVSPARNKSYYLQPAGNKNIFRPTRYWCMVSWYGSPSLLLLQLFPPLKRTDLYKWPNHILPAALNSTKRNLDRWYQPHCSIPRHSNPPIAGGGGTKPFTSRNRTCKVSRYFQQKNRFYSNGE